MIKYLKKNIIPFILDAIECTIMVFRILFDYYKRKYNDFHDSLFNFEGEEDLAEQEDPEELEMLEDTWYNYGENSKRGYTTKYDILFIVIIYFIMLFVYAIGIPIDVEIDIDPKENEK